MNWEPSSPAGWRQVPDPTMTEHGICPGASICYIYSGIKLGEEWLFKSWFCQYISLPTKYTISGSILHYKVGLTLSFLSLISRGVGGIQKGNASTVYFGGEKKVAAATKRSARGSRRRAQTAAQCTAVRQARCSVTAARRTRKSEMILPTRSGWPGGQAVRRDCGRQFC